MGKYEYKVLPTPRRAKRVKGVKGEPARFAHALTELMNIQAAEGWEYFKSETLPMEAKPGMFKGVTETFQCVLVFRRSLEAEDEGQILSVTQAPPIEMPAPDPEPPVRTHPITAERDPKSETLRAVEDVVEAEKQSLTFDEDNVDPLKNLVEGHRGQKSTD